MKSVQLRYSQTRMPLAVPETATVLRSPEIVPLPDPLAAIKAALSSPINSAPLAHIVRQKHPQTVAITISDITRPVPNEPIVQALTECLNTCGIHDDQIVIIIATGMHRPSTPAERETMLGSDLLKRFEVIDHNADDAASMVKVSDDPPVSVNARFARADLKLVTGLIEPHFMAGYSGGRKGVCPGLVDLATVQRFHGYRTMGDPCSIEGQLQGNPCHELSLQMARLVGVDFLVNVAITHDRRMAGVYAGDMESAHAAGCRQVGTWTTAQVDAPFDLVITCGGGYPLDATFYQTVKGMVTALPAMHEHSTLLVISACNEIGSPEYTDLMLRYNNDWKRFLTDIAHSTQTKKDQWQLQMHTRVLARLGLERLRFVNDGLPQDLQQRLCVSPITGQANAQHRAQTFINDYLTAHPHARIAIIPEGPYTMLKPPPRK